MRNTENVYVYNGNYELVSTYAHEFNHCAAMQKGLTTDSNIENQEISGHVYAFTTGYNGGTILNPFYKATVSELAPGYDILKIDWSEYTGNNNRNLTNSVQWNIHYNRLASVEYYIWQSWPRLKRIKRPRLVLVRQYLLHL